MYLTACFTALSIIWLAVICLPGEDVVAKYVPIFSLVLLMGLYVFDPVDDCSVWVVDCVDRFLVDCLAAFFLFFCFEILSVIAVQCVYR